VAEQQAAPEKAVVQEAAKEVPKAAVVVTTPVPLEKPAAPIVNPGKLTIMVPDFSSERFDRLWTAGEGANSYMIYLHSALQESDANRRMIPGIATEWSINEDGSSYSFKIRKGVKFHDGTELTPEDALWTYQHSFGPQALDYAIGSGYLKAARIAKDISLTEPDVLTISFTEPYLEHGPVESNTGSSPTGIMPGRTALNDIEVSEAFDRNPIGAGPMMLTDFTPQSSMTFERFEDYYYQPANGLPEDRRPQFQTLELVLVGEMATRVAALRAGEADIVPLQLSAKSQVEAGGARLVFINEGVAYDNPWIHCWAMGSDHPCQSKQVRQALNYAINKDIIQTKLYGGTDVFGIGGLGFITPSVMGYTAGLDPFSYDPDKARQLLSDAGYPGGAGFSTTIKLNAAPSGVIPFLVETAQFIADSWKKELNIPVEVVVHDYNAMKKLRRTDALDGEIYFSRKAASVDPGSNVFRFYGSDEEDKRRGQDPELMQRVQDATFIVDRDARQKALEKVLPEVRDEALTLILGYVNTPWGVGPRVETWTPWPLTDYASAIWTVKLK
jgi:peptide/nickel transport system substrate-binding protein